MKKILWFFSIIFFGGLIAFSGYNSLNKPSVKPQTYEPSPLTLIIDWEITKPFQLQIFYKATRYSQFNEKDSIRRQVTPADKHIEIVLPVKHIYNFRIDFGANPQHIIIRNIEIKGDIYLNFNQWNNYVYQNIEKVKIKEDENVLKLYSSHNDPYMFFNVPFLLDAQKSKDKASH